VDIRWLQDFLTVAETGNFTRAAEIRNISQAAFSRRIKSLEEWLGTALIDRAAFPTRLTAAGERFRERATELVQQLADARIGLSGTDAGRRSQIRIALPHALATGRLPSWWSAWSKKGTLDARCTAVPGNVHDTVTALVSGSADVLICFHTAQQPIHLSPEQYERVVIGTEDFRPYVASGLARQVRKAFPGNRENPLPLLMYSQGAYLARMVDLVIDSAPQRLVGRHVFESDMADVLRNMAVSGHGIAWLPQCTAAGAAEGELAPIETEGWSLKLSVVAYRDKHRRRAPVDRLWTALSSRPVR
jgi:LysR family transcriptional regulator, hypochlorite-specific transcription factor HypT